MGKIDLLIRDLKSDSAVVRYRACAKLGNEQSIPEEAIAALRIVALDPTPQVADAAARALSAHIQNSTSLLPEGTPTPTHNLRAVVGILAPGFILVACAFLSAIAEQFNSPGGNLENMPWNFEDVVVLYLAISVLFIAGAVAGALGYYGECALKYKSITLSKVLGLISVVLGTILFLALLCFTVFAVGIFNVG